MNSTPNTQTASLAALLVAAHDRIAETAQENHPIDPILSITTKAA